MKSVKQQFIDLKEGKMNQAQFMRNVRMTLPHLVTNTTSFDDTVKILRNKAILTEADIKDKNQEINKIFAKKTIVNMLNRICIMDDLLLTKY